jgi:hypothetical protein
MGFDTNAKNDSRQRRAMQHMVAAQVLGDAVANEEPAGAIDGVNAEFNLARVPAEGTLLVFRNGLLLSEGATDDYELAGKTITFTADALPLVGSKVRAFYKATN